MPRELPSGGPIVFLRVAAAIAFGLILAPRGFATELPAVDAGGRLALAVRYGDLDLESQAGVAALYGRLRAAARQVCPEVDPRELRLAAERRACRAHALDDAVSRLGHPALTALHANRSTTPRLAANVAARGTR